MSTGVIMILVGYAMTYFVRRARFNRVNSSGVSMHRSYEAAVWFNTWTKVTKLAGIALMLIGVLYFFAGVS